MIPRSKPSSRLRYSCAALVLVSALSHSPLIWAEGTTSAAAPAGAGGGIATLNDLYNEMVNFLTGLALDADAGIQKIVNTFHVASKTQQMGGQQRTAPMNAEVTAEISGATSPAELASVSEDISKEAQKAFDLLIYPLWGVNPERMMLRRGPIADVMRNADITKEAAILKTALQAELMLNKCKEDLKTGGNVAAGPEGSSDSDAPTDPTLCSIASANTIIDQARAHIKKSKLPGAPASVLTAVDNLQSDAVNTGDNDTPELATDDINAALAAIPAVSNWLKRNLMERILKSLSSSANGHHKLASYSLDSLLQPDAYDATPVPAALAALSNSPPPVCSPKVTTGVTAAKNSALSYLGMLGQLAPRPSDTSIPQIPVSASQMLGDGRAMSLSDIEYPASATNKKAEIIRLRKQTAPVISGLQGAYRSGLRTYFSTRNMALSNLYTLYSDRAINIPTQIETADGVKKTAVCTPHEINHYQAQWRFDPRAKWRENIAATTPANVNRQAVYLLAEIRQQLYLNQQLLERMLATMSIVQLQSAKTGSDTLVNLKSQLEEAIKTYVKGESKANSSTKAIGAAGVSAASGSKPGPSGTGIPDQPDASSLNNVDF